MTMEKDLLRLISERFFLPLRFWSQGSYFLLLLLSGLTTVSVGYVVEGRLSSALARSEQAFNALEAELQRVKNARPEQPAPSLASQLPKVSLSHDVVKQLGRTAQPTGVELASIELGALSVKDADIGAISIRMSASGDYSGLKRWLASTMDRYPSLALTHLSFRSGAGADAARVDAQISLSLYVQLP